MGKGGGGKGGSCGSKSKGSTSSFNTNIGINNVDYIKNTILQQQFTTTTNGNHKNLSTVSGNNQNNNKHSNSNHNNNSNQGGTNYKNYYNNNPKRNYQQAIGDFINSLFVNVAFYEVMGALVNKLFYNEVPSKLSQKRWFINNLIYNKPKVENYLTKLNKNVMKSVRNEYSRGVKEEFKFLIN
ncbi:hypothetical protein ABK040_007997 [Willaertia magna]